MAVVELELPTGYEACESLENGFSDWRCLSTVRSSFQIFYIFKNFSVIFRYYEMALADLGYQNTRSQKQRSCFTLTR